MAKKDIEDRNIFQRVEWRATEHNRPGAYSLEIEEESNPGVDSCSERGGHGSRGGGGLKHLPNLISYLVHASPYFFFWKRIFVAVILSVLSLHFGCVESRDEEKLLRPDVVRINIKLFSFILMLFLDFEFFHLGGKWVCFMCKTEREANYLWVRLETSRLCFTLFFILSLSLRAIIHSSLLTYIWPCDLLGKMKYEQML